MYGAWHLELHGRLGNPAITKEAVTIYDKSARNVKNSHSLNGRIHVAIGVLQHVAGRATVLGHRSSVYSTFFLRKRIFKENKYENARLNEGHEGEGVLPWNKLFILTRICSLIKYHDVLPI